MTTEEPEIPDWIEPGMHIQDTESKMHYEVRDIAESKIDDRDILILNLVDNAEVQNAVYQYEFEYKEYDKLQPPECPLCSERGMIKHSNLTRCMNEGCDVAEYRRSPEKVSNEGDQE